MKKLIALMLVAVLLLVPAVALASDITGAKWYSIITVSNNGTATTDTFITFPLGTQNLIDSGFLSANLTDCAMHDTSGVDTAFMPAANSTYPWCLYASNIGENAFRNYLLYTGGNTDMDSKIRYFPADGGMISTDNATLELSDNFTIEQKGFVDTDNATDKNLVYKKGAFSLYVSPTVSENITAAILEWSANFTEVRRPDGHDTCVIPSESGAACNDHWQNVDEAVADDPVTEVHCTATGATTYTDIYTLEDTSINATSRIIQIQTTIRGQIIGAGQYRVGLRLGTDITWGALFADAAWASHNEVLAKPGGGSWALSDLDDLLIMVYVVAGGAGGNSAYVTQCYITTTFQNPVETVSVTATGVENGEHTVRVDSAGGLLGLGIDLSDSNIGLPLTDNLIFNAPLWHTELDGSPFTTKDISEHSVTVTGAVWSATNGRIFDGNDFLALPAGDGLTPETGSMTFWLYLEDTGNSEYFYSSGANELSTRRFGAGSGVLIFYYNSVEEMSWNIVASAGEWIHIAFTWTKGGGSIGYEDATQQDTSTIDNTAPTEVIPKIGSRSNGVEHLDGRIGEFQIYDRVLSAPEITSQYNATKWKYDGSSDYYYYQVGATVPDTAFDWTFIENYSMPYMEYHKIWIGGVLQQHIVYEYNDAIFSDLSANGNPAIPTFRAASSDADVSASMASFSPVDEAQAPPWVLEEERDFWDTENITAASTFLTTPTPTVAPGVAIVEAISEATGTPAQLPFTIITGFIILAVSLTASWFLAKHGSRNLWLKIIFITVLMAFAVGVKIFDFWMVLFFLIMAIAVALFSRQRSTV